jgi:translation initiation factor 2 beta subunit (eIF-2beta)/eIF-5
MIKKIVNQLSLKLLIAGILFSFYACGTPANTENTTESETNGEANTEIQQTVNKEANTEQENLEYSEKSEATNQAIAFYEALKNGLYENTTAMVEQNMYNGFSAATWVETLKKEAGTKGQVEKYALQTSKYEKAEGTNSGRKVEMTFEVTRNGKKHLEEMDWYKTDGEPFLLTKMEYKLEASTEEDDD